MKRTIIALFSFLLAFAVEAQTELKRVYNEDINPNEQIDQALVKAKTDADYYYVDYNILKIFFYKFRLFT